MKKLTLAIGICFIFAIQDAHSVTGFLAGEEDSGMNKICYYDTVSGKRTINLSSVSLCPLSYNFPDTNSSSSSNPSQRNNSYVTGFLDGERVSGMNKICYYNTVSGQRTINISSVGLCPLTKNFPR